MMTPYCYGCHQPMPRRTVSGYCDHCNPGQEEPSRASGYVLVGALGLLLGGVMVGLVMMQVAG